MGIIAQGFRVWDLGFRGITATVQFRGHHGILLGMRFAN